MSEVAATGISVLLVDDHPIVRQGYRRVLESQGDLHVVAEADNAADAYSAFKAHDPDVVLLDISMPGASGLEAIRNIRARSPRARILVFTMHNEAVLVKAAFSAGASGFVTKSSEPSAVVTAIRAVARGERAMSDDIAHISPRTVCRRAQRWISWASGRSRSCASSPAAPPPSRSRRTSISV
ncbi:hypothetical protein BROWWM01_39860 [Bradyrhizobium ottawaense]